MMLSSIASRGPETGHSPPKGSLVKPKATRSYVASLTYQVIEPTLLGTLACRKCRGPLDLHQPNPQQPFLFLGTCPGCGQWYTIGSADRDDAPMTVLELPDVASIPGEG